jgi:Arc/MetJ family transcription regulator
MKTTVHISDPLLEEAKALAAAEGTTLRELVEAGLRQIVAERRRRRKAFRLRDASFTGRGLQPEFQGAGWDQIRDAIYQGQGHGPANVR